MNRSGSRTIPWRTQAIDQAVQLQTASVGALTLLGLLFLSASSCTEKDSTSLASTTGDKGSAVKVVEPPQSAASPSLPAPTEETIAPGAATPSDKRALHPALAILLLGDRDESQAEAKAAAFALPPNIAAAPGYPRLVDSGTIEGLKPGFHVLVLGMCKALESRPVETGDEAGSMMNASFSHEKRIAAAVGQQISGSYARQVSSAAPDSCPLVLPESFDDPEGLRLFKRASSTGSAADLVALGAKVEELTGDLDLADNFYSLALSRDPQHLGAQHQIAKVRFVQ